MHFLLLYKHYYTLWGKKEQEKREYPFSAKSTIFSEFIFKKTNAQ